MSTEIENTSDLAFMLGRIQGDVKHILTALVSNQEQFSNISLKFDAMDKRLDRLEQFHVRVITAVSILVPLGTLGVNFVFKYFGF